MTAQYFRFTPDVNIKSSTLAPWGGVPTGVVFPQWYYNNALELANGTLQLTPVSSIVSSGSSSGVVLNLLTVPNILTVPNLLGSPGSVGTNGYIVAASDGASGSFLLQHSGFLIDYTAGGTLTAYQDMSMAIFKGLTVSGTTPWMVDVSGHIFTTLGTNIVQSGAFHAIPTYGLERVGSTLWTVAASASGSGGIASYNIANGVSGFVATPMPTPALIAASGNLIAVAGWSPGPIANVNGTASGFYSIGIDPILPNILVGANSDNNSTTIWNRDARGNWVLGQTVAGAAQFIVWNPNGTQLLAANPTNNTVYAFTFILGTLAQQATFAVSGANWVGFSANGNEALVASPNINLLTSLVTSGAGWAVSGTLSAPTPSTVATFSQDAVLVGHVSGVTQYNFATGHWTAGTFTPFPFTVKSIALDQNSGIAVAGVSGVSGFVSYAGSTISYTGGAEYILYRNGQILVSDASAHLIRVFGVTNGVLSLQNTVSIVTSGTGYAMTAGAQGDPTIYVFSHSICYLNHLAGPYQLAPLPFGQVSIYNTATSGFVTALLKMNQQPEAIAWDPSGNVTVVTLQNTIWSITSGATVLVSGATIAQFSGQSSGTPIGISDLLWVGNALYGSTILNDSLVQVQ